MKRLPNILTLSRIPLLFVIVGLLCLNRPATDAAAFVFFLVAAGSDWLDGYIARKVGAVSNFGKLMDALTDKIIMVGLFVALLGLNWNGDPSETILPRELSVFCVIIIICREFLITGLRLVAASNGVVLAAERAGKLKTALQMLSVSLLLCAQTLAGGLFTETTLEAGACLVREIGLWAFYGAVALTIYSGTGYIIRNWRILNL